MEGKKSLPHLYNFGKPSEMNAKDFYDFVNWLDENDGIINDNNSQINEKLDGSSQFFGYDKQGFFWEKFGGDMKYRSENDIPEIFGRYKPFFTEMKSILEPYFKSLFESFEQETKAQIEVITIYGAKNEDNLLINLVPYKKSAFKSKGCLSVIQVLVGEKNPAIEDELKQDIVSLLKDSDYTVFAGYSLDNYSIDLSEPATELIYALEGYPFEEESERFKITLTEIEDVLDLPTRKFNQSKLKEIFAKYKEIFSNRILEELKDNTGKLSEDGMFEGLAITLNNGFQFKVNSNNFKNAFTAKKQLEVANRKKVQESKGTGENKYKLEDIFADKKEFPSAHKMTKEDMTETFLEDLKYQLKKELSQTLENIEFSWKQNNMLNVCDKLTGREVVISDLIVDEPKVGEYFIFIPNISDKDRTYASVYFFKDKNKTFASVNDAINFPKEHEYYLFTFRKHNNQNMTGDTAIQECMQGIACDLAKYHSGFDSLLNAIQDKIRKNGFSSIPISGGNVKVKDFNEEKLQTYIKPAVRTGLAFINEFSEIIGTNTKTYHPDIDGPLKTILEIGKPLLNGLKKDCWNPTDILITDYTSEEIKKLLEPAQSLSELNSIMKDLINNSKLGKCFIPLSLKLNTSPERDSVVEKMNLEESAKDYHVSNHYVNTNGVGNEIDVFAHINGKAYKFYFRCNGTTSPVIEGQHYDSDKYFKNSKFVDDTSKTRDVINRDDIDIESFKVNEKDNTSSFLGKAKTILFSAISDKEFKEKKKTINFNSEDRNNYHEGSLPWRLVEMADKIEAMPDGYGAKGKQTGHDSRKAKAVAELARDYAYLAVMMNWNTEKAIIYMLTCSMKENFGAFNSFAPLYKIS